MLELRRFLAWQLGQTWRALLKLALILLAITAIALTGIAFLDLTGADSGLAANARYFWIEAVVIVAGVTLFTRLRAWLRAGRAYKSYWVTVEQNREDLLRHLKAIQKVKGTDTRAPEPDYLAVLLRPTDAIELTEARADSDEEETKDAWTPNRRLLDVIRRLRRAYRNYLASGGRNDIRAAIPMEELDVRLDGAYDAIRHLQYNANSPLPVSLLESDLNAACSRINSIGRQKPHWR